MMNKANTTGMEEPRVELRRLVAENRLAEAFKLIAKQGSMDATLRNIYGVCLMRSGEVDKAIDVYRELCVAPGLGLKSGMPVECHLNYATALLMQGNVAGCLDTIQLAGASNHPMAIRLRAAVKKWRKSLTMRQRIGLMVGLSADDRPVELGFRPGEDAASQDGPARA